MWEAGTIDRLLLGTYIQDLDALVLFSSKHNIKAISIINPLLSHLHHFYYFEVLINISICLSGLDLLGRIIYAPPSVFRR